MHVEKKKKKYSFYLYDVHVGENISHRKKTKLWLIITYEFNGITYLILNICWLRKNSLQRKNFLQKSIFPMRDFMRVLLLFIMRVSQLRKNVLSISEMKREKSITVFIQSIVLSRKLRSLFWAVNLKVLC